MPLLEPGLTYRRRDGEIALIAYKEIRVYADGTIRVRYSDGGHLLWDDGGKYVHTAMPTHAFDLVEDPQGGDLSAAIEAERLALKAITDPGDPNSETLP